MRTALDGIDPHLASGMDLIEQQIVGAADPEIAAGPRGLEQALDHGLAAAFDRGPIVVEERIDGVDRNRSLIIGISTGLLAFWCLYRVLWSIYLSLTYDFLFGSLVFSIVLWGVIGAVATIAATAFLTRYAKRP